VAPFFCAALFVAVGFYGAMHMHERHYIIVFLVCRCLHVVAVQGRRRGVNWGRYVRPTFLRGSSDIDEFWG